MKFLRNTEVRNSLIAILLISLIFCAVAFSRSRRYGLFTLALCLIFLAFYIVVTYRRYRKLARLSRMIDRILHGEEALDLQEYSEGELAILQNEVTKMTVRLREQAEALRRDKVFLTDSIADISHQLKTPMTSIRLIVTLLEREDISYERGMELTGDLKRLLGRIDWLISSLLKMSQIDAGTVLFQQKPVSVAEVIRRAAEPIAISMDLRGQSLLLSIGGDAVYDGDFAWSVEAFGNILKNCMEHSGDGGEIRVTALRNAIYTEVIVHDNGPGIDPQDLPHLFERFYKGKNATDQSFGIGLALARMIITRQNGSVKAENSRGGGASFIVRFYHHPQSEQPS